MSAIYPFWIAGKPATSDVVADVIHPGDGKVVGQYYVPNAAQVEEAVAAAWESRHVARRTTAAQRADALMHISKRLTERAEEIAQLILDENGKPLMWARAESSRAGMTFRWAAEEVRRFSGELQRLDTEAATAGRMAIIRRFPHGPVLGISPFNFPMNLVAHKVAPAIEVMDAARALAAEICLSAPLSIAAVLDIIRVTEDLSIADGYAAMRKNEAYMKAINSEDAMEGPNAFAEKRDPVWKGK